jgi:hypothetical protein
MPRLTLVLSSTNPDFESLSSAKGGTVVAFESLKIKAWHQAIDQRDVGAAGLPLATSMSSWIAAAAMSRSKAAVALGGCARSSRPFANPCLYEADLLADGGGLFGLRPSIYPSVISRSKRSTKGLALGFVHHAR